jgi:hypothetical protein
VQICCVTTRFPSSIGFLAPFIPAIWSAMGLNFRYHSSCCRRCMVIHYAKKEWCLLYLHAMPSHVVCWVCFLHGKNESQFVILLTFPKGLSAPKYRIGVIKIVSFHCLPLFNLLKRSGYYMHMLEHCILLFYSRTRTRVNRVCHKSVLVVSTLER